MNLGDLRTQLSARGFSHLPSPLMDAYLNYAYQVDICEDTDWPFLEEVATGPSPLTISDLGRVLKVVPSVSDSETDDLQATQAFAPMDRRQVGADPGMVYYFDGADTIVAPSADTDLTVLYHKVPEAMSNPASDEPLLPERFHMLVVDGAVVRAYERASEFDNANNARTTFYNNLQRMREALIGRNHDDFPQFVEVRNATDA